MLMCAQNCMEDQDERFVNVPGLRERTSDIIVYQPYDMQQTAHIVSLTAV